MVGKEAEDGRIVKRLTIWGLGDSNSVNLDVPQPADDRMATWRETKHYETRNTNT